MRQLEHDLAYDDESGADDPSTSLLAEVAKADGETERRALELYGAGALPFLALCDGDFLRNVSESIDAM